MRSAWKLVLWNLPVGALIVLATAGRTGAFWAVIAANVLGYVEGKWYGGRYERRRNG